MAVWGPYITRRRGMSLSLPVSLTLVPPAPSPVPPSPGSSTWYLQAQFLFVFYQSVMLQRPLFVLRPPGCRIEALVWMPCVPL